jgi:hypothetical protein
MHQKDSLMDKTVSDLKAARERFELYEKFYLSLSDKARQYLRNESKKYKRSLKEIQGLILPSVKKICPACDGQCCRLYTTELSIYITGTVGGFSLNDYLLARCDEILPDPCYENAVKNLCPFSDLGCILPVDCRSFLCIQFFCDKLKKSLDMKPVLECLGKLRAILDSFSIGKCMV